MGWPLARRSTDRTDERKVLGCQCPFIRKRSGLTTSPLNRATHQNVVSIFSKKKPYQFLCGDCQFCRLSARLLLFKKADVCFSLLQIMSPFSTIDHYFGCFTLELNQKFLTIVVTRSRRHTKKTPGFPIYFNCLL